MPLPTPEFEVVPAREARRRRSPRRARRNWTPVINALVAGRTLWFPDAELSDGGKYLTLCLHRRGKGERLRTERETRNDREGRMVWVTTDELTPVEVAAEEVDLPEAE